LTDRQLASSEPAAPRSRYDGPALSGQFTQRMSGR
jgi:hypothetical protein